MNYQGTAYSYNQRAEVLLPTRRGTTYYGSQNHKPLIIYKDLDIDIEFFVIDTDRKPVQLTNKTFVAKIIDRTTNSVRVSKTLVPVNSFGSLVMRISQDDSASLNAALYDLVITYTDTDGRTFGLQSDQNSRISFVLEVKDNPYLTIIPSNALTNFVDDGSGTQYSDLIESTAPKFNSDGTNTAAVYLTNYSGNFAAEATLELNPSGNDWFPIMLDPECSCNAWTFTNYTGVMPFTWDGMFQYVRFSHEPSGTNTGTLDKVLYRA